MPDELTVADIRRHIATLDANRLICACGRDKDWDMDLLAGHWVCPDCGARYDGITSKRIRWTRKVTTDLVCFAGAGCLLEFARVRLAA